MPRQLVTFFYIRISVDVISGTSTQTSSFQNHQGHNNRVVVIFISQYLTPYISSRTWSGFVVEFALPVRLDRSIPDDNINMN